MFFLSFINLAPLLAGSRSSCFTLMMTHFCSLTVSHRVGNNCVLFFVFFVFFKPAISAVCLTGYYDVNSESSPYTPQRSPYFHCLFSLSFTAKAFSLRGYTLLTCSWCAVKYGGGINFPSKAHLRCLLAQLYR